jgi:hypothetical protein
LAGSVLLDVCPSPGTRRSRSLVLLRGRCGRRCSTQRRIALILSRWIRWIPIGRSGSTGRRPRRRHRCGTGPPGSSLAGPIGRTFTSARSRPLVAGPRSTTCHRPVLHGKGSGRTDPIGVGRTVGGAQTIRRGRVRRRTRRRQPVGSRPTLRTRRGPVAGGSVGGWATLGTSLCPAVARGRTVGGMGCQAVASWAGRTEAGGRAGAGGAGTRKCCAAGGSLAGPRRSTGSWLSGARRRTTGAVASRAEWWLLSLRSSG